MMSRHYRRVQDANKNQKPWQFIDIIIHQQNHIKIQSGSSKTSCPDISADVCIAEKLDIISPKK